eukprot:gene7991-biopygen9126
MPDVVQEWHAEDVIFEAFWRIFSAFWTTKLAKNDLKDALQRRGYLRSLPMGPIDGTHGIQAGVPPVLSHCRDKAEQRGCPSILASKTREKCLEDAPHASKIMQSDLKDALQRRGFTHSLPMGCIDGSYGQKWLEVRAAASRPVSSSQNGVPAGQPKRRSGRGLAAKTAFRPGSSSQNGVNNRKGRTLLPTCRNGQQQVVVHPFSGATPGAGGGGWAAGALCIRQIHTLDDPGASPKHRPQ